MKNKILENETTEQLYFTVDDILNDNDINDLDLSKEKDDFER